MASRSWSSIRCASCVVVTSGGTVAAGDLEDHPASPAVRRAAGLADRGREDAVTASAVSSSLACRRARSVAVLRLRADLAGERLDGLALVEALDELARLLGEALRRPRLAPLARRPRRGPRRGCARAPARSRSRRTRHSRRPGCAGPRCRRRYPTRRRRAAARRARAGSTGLAGLVLAGSVDGRHLDERRGPSPGRSRRAAAREARRSSIGRGRRRSRSRARSWAISRFTSPATSSKGRTASGWTLATRTSTVPNRPSTGPLTAPSCKREGGVGDRRVEHLGSW